jgi:hypothetical protein
VTPELAKSIDITPLLIIGLLVTTSLVEDTGATPTLVTVPPEPLPPPVELIVIAPEFPVKIIPVPAFRLVTPVLLIVTVFVFESGVVEMPVPPITVGLELLNNVLKLVTVFLNAVYNESLPIDSLGRPTFITSCPEIAII